MWGQLAKMAGQALMNSREQEAPPAAPGTPARVSGYDGSPDFYDQLMARDQERDQRMEGGAMSRIGNKFRDFAGSVGGHLEEMAPHLMMQMMQGPQEMPRAMPMNRLR